MSTDPLIRITDLAQSLAHTARATRGIDGAPESVADHTVHLAWVAVAFCPPHMDPARVALFAVAHDLLEAVTGDLDTFTAGPEARAAKDAAERAALVTLSGWLPAPLLSAVIDYEAQKAPEARYVKIVDKAVPKLLHRIADRGRFATPAARAHLTSFLAAQRARLHADYSDQPEALAVYDRTTEILLSALP